MVLDAEFVPVGRADRRPLPRSRHLHRGRRQHRGRAAHAARRGALAGRGGPAGRCGRERGVEATTTGLHHVYLGHHGAVEGRVINNHFELSFAVVFNEIVALRADDVTYNFLPFFHIAGKFILLGTMLADCRMLLRPRFSAGQFWPDVRAHGATVTVGVGGICHMLWAEPRRPDDADNPLRMIYSVPNPPRGAGGIPRTLRPGVDRGLRLHRGQHRGLHPARRANAQGHGRAARALLRGGDLRRDGPPGAPGTSGEIVVPGQTPPSS